MLTIRLQRMGKTHYATYRVVVQDVRQHPSSGKVIAYLGSYNPHTKEVQLDKETATKFLTNGAQPTERVAKILSGEALNYQSGSRLPAALVNVLFAIPRSCARTSPRKRRLLPRKLPSLLLPQSR